MNVAARTKRRRATPWTPIALALLALLAGLLLQQFPDQVRAQSAPTINSAQHISMLEENSDPVSSTIGTYIVIDADMDTLTWSMEGLDAGSFVLDPSLTAPDTQFLRFLSAPDYETPTDNDGDNVYNVTVKVTDDESPAMSATVPVTVTVTNVNEEPTFDPYETNLRFDENTATSEILATFMASDPDENTELTWTVQNILSAGDFNIVRNADRHGELRFSDEPDYENLSGYALTVTVTDNGIPSDGMNTISVTTQQIVVRITNLDEAGTVTISGEASEGKQLTATVTDPDNGVIAGSPEWRWSWGSTATGTFTDISGATSSGMLSSSYRLAADDVGRYIRATATYLDHQSTTDTKTASAVSGQVAAGDGKPTFDDADTTRTVPENSEGGTNVGAPVTATAYSGTVTYTLGGTDAASFDIGAATGQLQTKAALDYETRSSYEATVTATNSEGSVDIMVTIEVTNIVEFQPLTGPATVDYEENRALRVATYTASSEEDQHGIRWLVADGADAAHFTVDATGGALRFHIDPVAPNIFPRLPDFESPDDDDADNEYSISLLAQAGLTISSPFAVTVTVTDVDEEGALSLSSTRPALGAVLTAVLSDPDGVTAGTALWQWERSTGRNAWAVIDGAAAASYTPVAADTNTFLRVTATYEDEHGTGKTVSEVAPNVVTGPLLTGLTAETDDSRADTARGLYPAFDPLTLHYGIGCNSTDTLVLTVSAAANARVAVAVHPPVPEALLAPGHQLVGVAGVQCRQRACFGGGDCG